MDEMKLPGHFDGSWENVLILTFGANLPFFENSLWRQFRNRCRNKIILADHNQFLEACRLYANNGLVRFLNQKYIADGISVPMSAHAKLIMLTNSEKGQMLIGSGNLSIDGYASGGELFTAYKYSENNAESLIAFLAAWDFIEEMIKRQYIGPVTVPYLRHLQKQTPWLFRAVPDVWNPVRHNLKSSFISQLKEELSGEPVEELWILSPFYDEKAHALETLLEVFTPRKVLILVQPKRTSLDPLALEKVLGRSRTACQVHTFRLKDDVNNTYVHAKLYLLKTNKRAICLQGSPNLSNAAMILTPPEGNIELANLLVGGRNDFDYLIDRLDIDPETPSLATLNIHYNRSEPKEILGIDGWKLVSGEWRDDELILRYSGNIPQLSEAFLEIGAENFNIVGLRIADQIIRLKISNDVRVLLERVLPLSIVWESPKGQTRSNPIFVCNLSGLDREMLESEGEIREIESVGNLDLDDDEFERLLAELDAALVVDRRSVWQMAGKPIPKEIDSDDEVLRLDYADIDYDLLRRHPKLAPYLTRKPYVDAQPYSRSRLQIILSSITGHFNGLVDLALGKSALDTFSHVLDNEIGDGEAETEEQREEEEKEKQKQKWSNKARVSATLRNFIRRYIRGIKSPDFLELAGPDVMARNYVIFSHLLWRMYAKEWVDYEFITESLIRIWKFFWGTLQHKGYFQVLDSLVQQQALELILRQHHDGLIIASTYYANSLIWGKKNDEVQLELRDFIRTLLERQPFVIGRETLEAAWIFLGSLYAINTPPPSRIASNLSTLAKFENQRTFLRGIEQRYGFPELSCDFIKQNVYRRHLHSSAVVDALIINDPNAIPSLQSALEIVQSWSKFHPRDYYRIVTPDKSKIFFFDVRDQSGLYYSAELNEEIPLTTIPNEEQTKWEDAINRLQALAAEIDDEISLNPTSIRDRVIIQFE